MRPILESVTIALNALNISKVRSFLTMLGVIIGVFSVILLVSIGSGLQRFIEKQFEEIGSNLLFIMPGKFSFRDSREGGPPGGGSKKITFEDIKYLENRSKYVVNLLPIITKTADIQWGRQAYNTFVIGTTETYTTIRRSPVSSGKFFTKSHAQTGKKVAVIGTTVSEKLFKKTDPLNKKIRVSGVTYTVIGVLTTKGASVGSDQDDQIIIPFTAYQRQFNPGGVSYVYAEIAKNGDLGLAKAEIENILGRIKKRDDFSVVDQRELLSTISSILSVLTLGLGGIAAISLLVGGIGIMNIMLVSVTERTREIGLRKAVGATPKTILRQFLIEAVILSFGGGGIGVVLGMLVSLILSKFLPTSVTLWSILLAFGVSGCVGLIFGVAPAFKAAKLNPIDALRHE